MLDVGGVEGVDVVGCPGLDVVAGGCEFVTGGFVGLLFVPVVLFAGVLSGVGDVDCTSDSSGVWVSVGTSEVKISDGSVVLVPVVSSIVLSLDVWDMILLFPQAVKENMIHITVMTVSSPFINPHRLSFSLYTKNDMCYY